MQIKSSDNPYFMRFFAKKINPSRATVPTNKDRRKRKRVRKSRFARQWPN